MLPALAIHQPFAWLIAAGHKDIENRSWTTRHRGSLLIYATTRQFTQPWPYPEITPPPRLTTGGIIGMVDVIDVVTSSPSPWFTGPYGFVLANPRLFSGQQRIFIP